MYTRQHCVHEMISVTCFFFGLDTAAYSGLHGCYPSTRRAQVAAHPKRKDAVSKVRIMMHQKFPDKVPKMIAYMLTILQAQQEFEDPGWRIYNHNYRLKAAASGNQKRAEVDPHLYSQCFTGQAKKVVPACAKCNSFRHVQEDCLHGSPLAVQ